MIPYKIRKLQKISILLKPYHSFILQPISVQPELYQSYQ